MRLLIPTLSYFALAMLLLACAKVMVQYDKSADFTTFKTFSFLKPEVKNGKNPLYQNPLLLKNTQQEISQQLNAKGMQEVKTKPDVYIKIHTFVEKKTLKVASAAPRYGYYGGRGYGSYSMRGGVQTIRYNEGTLIIDVLNGKDKDDLLWRGSIKSDVDNVQRLEQKLRRGVDLIFKKYPS
ncbi:MAG TPA: hypothetical protein DCM08_09500 [Microscillaceae bacterium]|jgi:hypothetical protein|nr:hypothetical protein [Microscillaceae bacterium]